MYSSFQHQDEDDDEETGYLHDQIRRLTAIVREYQRRYLPINEDIVEKAPLAPWMTDSSMLSPLLAEYDHELGSLREQVKEYENEFHRIQEKSEIIVEENNRLHQEIRHNVVSQLNNIQQSDGLSFQTKQQLEQLQQRLQHISEEKDHTRMLYEESSRELQNVKDELRNRVQEMESLNTQLASTQDDLNKARMFAESLQKTNYQLKRESEQYLKTAQIQDSEMDDFKTQNRKLNAEIKTLKTLNAELQSHNNKLKEQLRFVDKDAMKEMITEKSAEGTICKLQNEIAELDSRVLSYAKELSKVRVEKTELEEQLSSLQLKNTAIEDNEYQAILRVRDSVQLVENALLEREEAIIREQQKTQEVGRLQEAINTLLKQADEQRKQEVTSIKTQSNKQIQQFMEDLHCYEVKGAEKQALLERITREKESLGKELEKIYAESPTEVMKVGLTLEELQKRLSKVELSRDETLLQYDALQTTLRRNKSRWESAKTVYENQINGYKKQIKTLKDDLDEISESRLSLLEETNSLKKELLNKREDNAALDMSCASQVSSLQQKLEMKEKEFASRLRASDDLNNSSMSELREMLTLQQKNASKWRDESRSLCQKFENNIAQLRQENNQLKRRNEELSQAYNECQHKMEEMEKEYFSNQVTIEKLQRLYSNAEERGETASTQVHTLLNREKQLLRDRKSLNREVDKLRLDMSRPSRKTTVDQQWDSYIENYSKDNL